jgi:hypothetical protein
LFAGGASCGAGGFSTGSTEVPPDGCEFAGINAGCAVAESPEGACGIGNGRGIWGSAIPIDVVAGIVGGSILKASREVFHR